MKKTFAADLQDEKILSQYLDEVYSNTKYNIRRVTDMSSQYKGIDLMINYDGTDIEVDEKAQLHFLNKDLPTFAFELSYLKNGKLKKGWLLDKSKETEIYFLIRSIHLKGSKSKLQSKDDIKSIDLTCVPRKKLIKYLKKNGLTDKKLNEYDQQIREDKISGKTSIDELDGYTQGNLHFTTHLKEKPINIILRIENLIDCGIAQKIST